MRVSPTRKSPKRSSRRSGNECVRETKSHRLNRPSPNLWPFLSPTLWRRVRLTSPFFLAVQTTNCVVRNRYLRLFNFFFQAEDGIRDDLVTGVQTCALPI